MPCAQGAPSICQLQPGLFCQARRSRDALKEDDAKPFPSRLIQQEMNAADKTAFHSPSLQPRGPGSLLQLTPDSTQEATVLGPGWQGMVVPFCLGSVDTAQSLAQTPTRGPAEEGYGEETS